MYVATFRKIWATIRHDIFDSCSKKKKELGVAILEVKDFNEICNAVHAQFEAIRADIYCLMLDKSDCKPGEAREIMQKAYVTYATVTTIKDEDGQPMRSRWPD